MNDPDRRQTSDGFDHDAMFADIVAHWDDPAAEPKPLSEPSTTDPATDHRAADDRSPDDHPHDDEATVDRTVDDHAHDEHTQDHGPASTPGAEDVVSGQPGIGHYHFPTDAHVVPPTPGEPQAIPAPQAWRAHDVDDDYEDHFEPPPVAPLPVGDLQFWGIIAGMGGGPLLLLYLVLFNREAGGYWMLTAIAMSVGGFALLVSRLPRDHEDDDDNGARL